MLENKIAELRKEKNLSQEQLAEILNTSRQAVSKWERGEAYPDIERLKDLAIFFGVSIDYLLDYDIESLLVSNYIERLKNGKEDKSFGVTIDEVKSMISKNSNNFDLLVYSLDYLYTFWNKSNPRDNSLLDLIITYSKKALAIYNKNNAVGIKIDDIKTLIALIYEVKHEYDLAKEYLKDANGVERDLAFANCEMALGNYESASGILTKTFVESVSSLISANISQLRLYLRTNQVKEAYDLADWSTSFIKSIGKSEEDFIDLLYIIVFLKACAERHLKYDWQESIDFLKSNINAISELNRFRSIELKLLDSKKIDYYILEDNIKDAVLDEIKMSKGSVIYNDLLETYKCIFGGIDNE